MLGLVSEGSASAQNPQNMVLPQVKVEIDEKKILGNILIKLRERKEMKLYVLMDSVKDIRLDNKILEMIVGSKDNFQVLNNAENIKIFNEVLKEMGHDLSVKFSLNEEKDEKVDIEEKLKNQFGKLFSVEGE